MSLPVIYRVKDAAQVLRCTESWLKRKAKARQIPVRLIGGEYAWTEDDLNLIVAQAAQEPAAPATGRPRKPRRPRAAPADAPVLTARKRRR